MHLLPLSIVVSALGFGFRHGIDWDHIAALTDLTATESSSKRSMLLATFYALGHASIVFVLGCVAILIGDRLPSSVDVVMERFVGATLILLAVYVFVSLVINGSEFRMRSRWMVLSSGLRALRSKLHKEDHHGHSHDRGSATSRRSAFAIGMIHGIGAESPTQVLIFVAAAGAGGHVAGLLVLTLFVVGLLISNTVVAAAATIGFISATRKFSVYATVSIITASASAFIGTLFLLGHSSALPALFGG